MEILSLIDRLETTVSSSVRVPGTRKVVLDADKMLEMVDELRLSVPKDLQEAHELMAMRETVINQALLDARRIKASAEEESRKQVDETEIVSQANEKAEELMSDAKRRADALLQDSQRQAHQMAQEAQSFQETRVKESNQYSYEVLARLEQQLSSVLNSVRLGLDSLEQREATKVD